jgi:DNA-directed RNA polymerase specialized sigma subunit
MYLGGVKARGRGINYEFFNTRTLPTRIEPTILESLVLRLRKGDITVISQIVDGHIRIAMQIVSRYHARLGRIDLCEDMLSEAFVAIVKGCRDAHAKLTDNNITPFLISKIHSAISDFIDRAKTIAVPPSTYRFNGTLAPEFEELQDVQSRDNVLNTLIGAELYSRICVTKMQQELVSLRDAGYSDYDIAKVFGVSRVTVTRLRNDIGSKLRELIREK